MAQKPVLGKGLASLFPDMENTAPLGTGSGAVAAGTAVPVQSQDTGNRDRHPGISLANLEEIQVNQYQPRRDFDDQALEELAQSIRTNGIIQPLIVRKDSNGGYQLIAGERRLRAAKLAGLKQVPIVIRRSTDRESLELALIENIQRQNLNCIDEALAYFQLLQDFSLTQEEIAHRVGKDRATISNFLRLLRLPEPIIDDLKRQILSFGHGKALLSLEDHELRLMVRAQIVEKHLSVRETENLVNRLRKDTKSREPTSADLGELAESIKKRLVNLAQELTRHWSMRVEVRGNDECGKIVIHYASREEFDRVLSAMQGRKPWETNPV